MSETALTLFIDLEPDTRIDLRTAARAAIAWADMVEQVGSHLYPTSPPIIELEAAEPGSQKIKAVIASLTEDPKATIRTAIVSSLVFVFGTTATWTWEQVLEWMAGPDAPAEVIELSDEERANLAKEVVKALDGRLGRTSAQRVYDELAVEPDVTGVGMSGTSAKPHTFVSRNDFPQIYIVEEEGFEKRERVETADLVLLRPVLTTETNKRWGFAWAHGKFGATIKDIGFLERLASGDLGIAMSEGIVFTVELEITEERRETIWEVKEYAVLRVLEVKPPATQDVLDLK